MLVMMATILYSYNTPGWFVVLAQVIKALIGNWHPALIWINGAEWEIICSSLAFGEHIKKCRFPATKSEKQQ